jgi:mxaJ protein
MCSRFRRTAGAVCQRFRLVGSLRCAVQDRSQKAGLILTLFLLASCNTRELRVCADPNNLPFSNQRLEGFENKIADVIAEDLHAKVRYTWWAQRRGFFRNTLGAGQCDVVMGVPSNFELAATTKPYYRSSYVFVYRATSGQNFHSLDDPLLRTVKIGVQLVGDDSGNTPPGQALSNRHIVSNVVGFTVYGNYAEESPPARIIDAIVNGSIDVAIVWGPLAGYFARKSSTPLSTVLVAPVMDRPALPFEFNISLGVRRTELALRDELQGVLDRRHEEIQKVLDEYGIPTL